MSIHDNIPSLTASVLDPKRKNDARDGLTHLELLSTLFLHPAIVTAVSADNSDEYIINIYARGFTKPDGTDETATHVGIVAHAMHNEDWFKKEACQVGKQILVHLLSDNTAWIKHPDEPQLGVVVCTDCNGVTESSLPENYYWVAFARIWNTDGLLPHNIAAYNPGSISYNVVAAENLFERNCQTHYVRPGTVVVLKWNLDNQSPVPERRYYFEIADEGTCLADPCPSSSSSASSGCAKVCWYKWVVLWNCNTMEFEAPFLEAPKCSAPDGPNPYAVEYPVDEWYFDGKTIGEKCIYVYVTKSNECCDTLGTCMDPPAYPGDPDPEYCCSSASSMSGSCSGNLCCYYTYEVTWDCESRTFTGPEITGHCMDCASLSTLDGDPFDVWLYRGPNATGTACLFTKHIKTPAQCCTNEDHCWQAPAIGDMPTYPERCCTYASASASGSVSAPCNPVKDVSIDIVDCKLTMTLTLCDNTVRTKVITVPCCCPPCNCSSASSSSSSSASYSGSDGICFEKWTTYYNCTTDEYNLAPDRAAFSCGNNWIGSPVGQWFNDGTSGSICTLAYIKNTGRECAGDCSPESDAPAGPTVAEAKALCCFGSNKCYYLYECDFDCDDSTFGAVEVSERRCGTPDRAINEWFRTDGSGCRLGICIEWGNCIDGECPDAPTGITPSTPDVAVAESLCMCAGSASGPDMYYQVNECFSPTGEGILQDDEFVPVALVPYLPFWFRDTANSRCYCVPAGRTPMTIGGGVVHLAIDERFNCACTQTSESGSASASGGARTWQQVRKCSDSTLVNKWIETTGEIVINGSVIRDNGTGTCYYVLVSDPDTGIQPANVIANWTFTAGTCEDCSKYWAVFVCGTGASTTFYVADPVKQQMVTDGELIFLREGSSVCYYVDTGAMVTTLPGGSSVVNPIATFAACVDCTGTPSGSSSSS